MVDALGHVLWIGGPPGAGKTTVARRIARRHGLRWYNADAHTWEHRDRALREGHAGAHRWEAMTPEERVLSTTPAEMYELSLHRERGTMIAGDLQRLPASPMIVAEGSTVMPELVATGIADRSRAVWLVPTREWQRARLEERRTGGRARENIIEYQLLIAAEVERQALACGVTVYAVDGTQGVDETVAAFEVLFEEPLAAGPHAATVVERRALLRYANEAVVAQALGYLARPWSTGDPEKFVREFVCECDDTECDETMELAVAAFQRAAEAGPVLAELHGG